MFTHNSEQTLDVYRHTEAVAYFNNAIPQGFDQPGPYDLTGKTVSCYVYLPSELIASGDPQAYVRLFVKDQSFHNQYGTALDITSELSEKWNLLSLVVGEGDIDPNFDSTKTNALGVRIELQNWAALQFEGQIYIDECEIEHP